jgi:hypothetical protein
MFNRRTKNYIIIASLIISFTFCIVGIKYANESLVADGENDADNSKSRLPKILLPAISLFSFLIGCYFVSKLIIEGDATGKDKYSGIIYMFLIGIILLILNATILDIELITDYIKGKKYNKIGVFMALGVGAIVFGFLDNFGMKLGTDALDDTFLQAFLSKFSEDSRFTGHKENIKENLKIMNNWVSNDWRKVMNHVLRFKDDIAKYPKLKDLTNSINSFKSSNLIIPSEILADRSKTNDYVDNLRSQYDTIDGSKAMMGNTFSDFIGALLGAGIMNLFIYMTGYDGAFTGDDTIDESPSIKSLNKYWPVVEAFFIALGCLAPIFLNIAMTRSNYNKNNRNAWIVVGIIGIIIIVMMVLSVTGIKEMTDADKKNSIIKTMDTLKKRLDLCITPENFKQITNEYTNNVVIKC